MIAGVMAVFEMLGMVCPRVLTLGEQERMLISRLQLNQSKAEDLFVIVVLQSSKNQGCTLRNENGVDDFRAILRRP
jgi:hypothetical protein